MMDQPGGSRRRARREARDAEAASTSVFDVSSRDERGLPPYLISEPSSAVSGVVFSSPHSGRAYFRDFVEGSRLCLRQLRASEDAYVDLLFRSASEYGAPMLAAVAPRAYVDLNRCPTDLDPNLLEGAARRPANARVAAGLGVVPRIVAEGVPIYEGKIDLEQGIARIKSWHKPYHQKLVELLEAARMRCGEALLIDCHSMPSVAVAHKRRRGAPVDIILGDRFGAACRRDLFNDIEEAFVSAGFRVERNTPFAGGFITERFGQPAVGVNAVQIEIDRGLYLDQTRVSPLESFETVRERLRPVIRQICDLIRDEAPSTPLAAE